jgi:nucleotide-binding universal stress UspA family protein
MKKILIAFDGTQFSEGAFEFAHRLNQISPILLTGVFLPQLSYANLWSYAGAMAGAVYVPMIEEEEAAQVDNNIRRFEELCTSNGIAYKVHRDFMDFALPELTRETRFADLLLISSEKFFEAFAGTQPSDYMREAIQETECPVVVLPESFVFPSQNVIAYDGSGSSVFALKQFAYLFPEFRNNETMMVYAKDREEHTLPSEEMVEELAGGYFNKLSIQKLDFNPRKFFTAWLQEERGAILVCGSFGRSSISQMFKKSFVSEVISAHRIPVFIAHH